ncbi:MAG: phosphoglucosamine mutase [Deltaproteobacteria bacterium]|nr:MAG: phosphoglucosamine mutase [Deltaproteobacteria bacterium]
MRKLFGTDGIRGRVNTYPVIPEIAMQVGQALVCQIRKSRKRCRIVIGRDTRLSCIMLEHALAAGICSMGGEVLLAGTIPTPGIALMVKDLRADAGLVISASHNPFQDNGIKIFAGDGFKLTDQAEIELENLILSAGMDSLRPAAEEIGGSLSVEDAKERYIGFLKKTFSASCSLNGCHMVLDCANGAGCGVAPQVFEELGAKVTAMGINPDGKNINQQCGALYPKAMAARVRELGADIGIALDGDGDRLIVADERGEIVDGDQLMAICAKELISKGRLKNQTLVATVMSNMGLEAAINQMGGKMVRTDVGDRYVIEYMRKNGCSFGGEQSGHLVFMDHITTGDGILAALQLLAVMQRQGKPLSELTGIMECFPQVLKNVKTSYRVEVSSIKGFSERVADFEQQLGRKGRILVRASGTEPVIRVMAEGQDEKLITRMADELCDMIADHNMRQL